MLARLLRRRDQRQRFVHGHAGCWYHIRQHRLARGNRPRLVQDDRGELVRRFQRFAALDQHPRFRTLAGADHDRRRRRQSKRARTRDDQYADRVDEGHREPRPWWHQQKPRDECGSGNAQHDWREHAADHVREPSDRRLRSLRILHELHDLLECGVLAHLRRTEPEASGLVHRRAEHYVARRLVHGQAFSRQHRLVNSRRPLRNLTIHGNLFARTHKHDVSRDHLLDSDIHLPRFPIHGTDDARGSCLETHKAPNRIARLPLGPRFQQAAKKDERDDDARRLVIDRRHRAPRLPHGHRADLRREA